jgi:proteic killer suppression protein
MIKSFQDKALRRFFETGNSKGLSVQNPARLRRILGALNEAKRPSDMNLPGWRFHSLAPGQPGRYAVDASGNWRITFAFEGGHAVDVDLEDYH